MAQAAWEVQKSLYALLSGDPTLAGMVSGVYDFVPVEADFPLVVIGRTKEERIVSPGVSTTAIGIEISVLSEASSREQCTEVAERVEHLLHSTALVPQGYLVVGSTIKGNVTQKLDEGGYYQSMIQWDVWVRPSAS